MPLLGEIIVVFVFGDDAESYLVWSNVTGNEKDCFELRPGTLYSFRSIVFCTAFLLIFVFRGVPRFEWAHGVLVQTNQRRISITFRFGDVTRREAEQYIANTGPVLLGDCDEFNGFAMV